MRDQRFPLTPWGAHGPMGLEAPINGQAVPQGPNRARTGRVRSLVDGDGNPLVPIFEESRFALLNGSTPLAVPNGSSILVFGNPNTVRNMLGFRNASATANIYLEFGGTASLKSWIRLVPTQIMLLDTTIPQDEVFAFADADAALLIGVQSSTPGQSIF